MANATVNQYHKGYEPFTIGNEEVDRANLPGVAVRRYADHVAAISDGVRVMLTTLQWNNDLKQAKEESEHPEKEMNPPLDNSDIFNIHRMMLASMEMLSNESEELMDWAYNYHTPEGRKNK